MRTHWLGAAVVVAALVPAVAGCGDDDSTTSSRGSSAAAKQSDANGGVAQAESKIAALRKAPTPLEIPALTNKPPTGKSAHWISCKFPECDAGDPGMAAAMKTAGWSLKTLKADLTPEAYAGAWSQAVAAKPTAIFATDLVPLPVIQSQLDAAEKQGTLVVLVGGATKAGDHGVDASVASVPWIGENGVVLTNWAIVDSKGEANILFLYDSSIPTHVAAYEQGKAEAAKLCPGCEVSGLPVKLAEAGKGIPGAVVSHLQKHPDVGYVFGGVSALEIGVGQAIKAAGLPVKVGTAASSPQDLVAVQKGVEAVAVTNELSSLAWRMADAAVRLSAGDTLPPELANPVGVRQLFDQSNIATADFETPWDVPDVPATFAEAWGVR